MKKLPGILNPNISYQFSFGTKTLIFQLFLGSVLLVTFILNKSDQLLDNSIITRHWLNRDEIAKKHKQLRSSLILTSIDAYLAAECYPLSLLKSYLDLEHE
jgi:hypothetical protein